MAVIKRSPNVALEAQQCIALGERVCPVVYAVTDKFYIMEHMQPSGVVRREDLPRAIHWLLLENVWRKPMKNRLWTHQFSSYVGWSVPEQILDEHWVLTHGDPTIANVMFTQDGQLRLIDPRVTEYIPSMRAVDEGKILQSMLGWETVLACEEPCVWNDPPTYDDRRVVWWTAVHARRILLREILKPEPCQAILAWAANVEGECRHASGF